MSLKQNTQQALNAWFELASPTVHEAWSLRQEGEQTTVDTLEEMANKLGIHLHYRELSGPILGTSFIHEGTRHTLLQRGSHPNLQLFTLAHEIGHHVLHVGKDSSRSYEEKELQAHLFAVNLLNGLADHGRVEEVLRDNPEGKFTLIASALIPSTLLLILAGHKLFHWLSPVIRKTVLGTKGLHASSVP